MSIIGNEGFMFEKTDSKYSYDGEGSILGRCLTGIQAFLRIMEITRIRFKKIS